MRILVLLSLFAFAAPAFAQTQESKLLDRLLRPDVGMQNTAQNKQFAISSNQTERHALVAPFKFQKKSKAKKFWGAREFGATNFATSHFRDGDGTVQVPKNNRLTKAANTTSSSTGNKNYAMANHRAAGTRNFASTRTFLDQGKSQKALSQQDKPLTIDQVRELLNKNK